MKKYIALRKAYFDKCYAINEEIPKDVIAQNMVSKLVRCGVIAVVETEQNSQNENDSEKELLQKKKEELLQMAEKMGLETAETMTKAELTALILQKGK